MTHYRPYFGRNMVVFCFWDHERGGGGGAPAAPASGSAIGASIKLTSSQRLVSVRIMVVVVVSNLVKQIS